MAVFGYHSTDWLHKYYGPLTSAIKKWDSKLLRKAFMMIEFMLPMVMHTMKMLIQYIVK